MDIHLVAEHSNILDVGLCVSAKIKRQNSVTHTRLQKFLVLLVWIVEFDREDHAHLRGLP
jgi:hypothetical protein